MFRSLTTKLMLGVVLILLIPMAAVYWVVAGDLDEQSTANFNRASLNELKQVGNLFEALMDEARANVSMVAAHPLMARAEESTSVFVDTAGDVPSRLRDDDAVGRELLAFFETVRRSHPNYLKVYLGTRRGAFVRSSDDKTVAKGYDPRKRPWFQLCAKKPGQVNVTNAYVSSNGMPIVSVCKAVPDAQGGMAGAVSFDIALEGLTRLVREIRIGRTGYVLLVQDDGVVLSDPRDPAQNFKPLGQTSHAPLAELLAGQGSAGTVTVAGQRYQTVVHAIPELGWKLAGLVERDELMEPTRNAARKLALVMAASLALIGLGIWLFARPLIIRPLRRAEAFLEDITHGRYGRMENARADEIGHILDALNALSATLKANMAEIGARTREAQEKAHACGLATEEANAAKRLAECARADGMRHAAGCLEQVVERLRLAVDALSGHSEAISKGSQVQRGRLTATVTAMDQMNATVLDVARNASRAASQGQEARGKAHRGSEVVARSVEAMRGTQRKALALRESMGRLDSQARSIGKILTTIEDIADQTNLLALNAAIEAARAGEAGRGFAVVADEVRKLAEKTMLATKEVGDSIQSIQRVAEANVRSVEDAAADLDRASDLTGESGVVLQEIVGGADASASQIQTIAAAAEEQSAAAEEINLALEEISAIAVETDEHVGASRGALKELEGQASALAGLLASLKEQSRREPEALA